MSTMTIQDKASEALKWFETAKRDGEDEPYFRTKDDTPEWVRDLVYAAHGDFLPDDWRYRIIYGALEFITDAEGDPMDDSGEFADVSVDAYTNDRLAWLSSNLQRPGYVDDAVENFGHSDQGIIGDIGAGQYQEASEIYALVLQALED